MGICAPNMKECDTKKKCLNGPNQGKAYNPKDPCCGVGTFDPLTCDCDTGCLRIYTRVKFGDGVLARGPNEGLRCSTEWCSDNYIIWRDAPITGSNPTGIDVVSFYSPESCGINTRGALISYKFPTVCDGTGDDVDRTYSAVVSNSIDFQPLVADVFVTPWPFPSGCSLGPKQGLASEGVGEVPSCFTLVASSINSQSDRIACPL